MDLRQLEILRAVAQTGSFTSAGEQLHLSQSAVSRQILLLEEELNEQLFLRLGRKIRITPAGTTLLGLSQRMFDDLEQTRASILDTQQNVKGTLRLVGGMTVCLYVFPPLLKAFRKEHPNVDVKLMPGATPRLIRQLRSGTADLGLLTLPVDDPALTSVPVMREELLLVTAPQHPLARKKQITPQDLARQPFVLFEAGSGTRKAIEEFFVAEHIAPDGRDRNRERRDHQGARAHRHGRHDHPVSGRRARGAIGPSVLRADCRPAARPRDRVGAPEAEPRAARRAGDDEDVRTHPLRAQAVAGRPAPPRQPARGGALPAEGTDGS